MEAVISKVKGVAVSLETPETGEEPADYTTAAIVARRVVERLMADGLPEGVVLNVNVPYLREEELKGYMITRQGLRVYRDALDQRLDPRGRPYYWIGGEAPTGVDEQGTDVGALLQGYVSITPLQLDLTHYMAMEVLKGWKWDELKGSEGTILDTTSFSPDQLNRLRRFFHGMNHFMVFMAEARPGADVRVVA